MANPNPSLDELRIERKPDRVRRRPLGLGVVAAAVLLLLAGGAWWLVRPDAIEVQTVTVRDLATGGRPQTVLNASGYVIARRKATVSSKVTGKITEVLIEEGMAVTNRQVLARLDDANIRANLEVALAQLASARAATEETRVLLQEADLSLERTRQLAEKQFAPQADLDQAAAAADSLRARLAKQEQDTAVADRRAALWRQQVEDMVIRAPFDGIVTAKNAQPGEMISPVSAGGGFTRTGIGTVVDMDSLEIEIDVNESYINRVEPGQPVAATLDAYPDWPIPCRVEAIIPTADRQRSTVRVRVGFDALDPRILPQMAVKVAFHDDADSGGPVGVTVPKASLREEDGQDVVFVVRNGVTERRAVTVAESVGEEVTVRAGLVSGEKVVVHPTPDLQDGDRVEEGSS